MNNLNIGQKLNSFFTRARKFESSFKLHGLLTTELYRGGRLIHVQQNHNDVVTVGKNFFLNTLFLNGSVPATWYQGLIDAASFTALAAGDTMASHTGWSEATYYAEGVRQTWTPTTSTSASLINGTAMTFTINATGTLEGAFLTTSNAVGGTTGTLWATVLYGSPVAVSNGDVIRNTYGISC